MKRIQIIFLFFIALTILSVVSDRGDSNYYSEYDTRFSCGLKYDFNILEIVKHKLNQENSREELTLADIQNGLITNDHQTQIKKVSGITEELPRLKKSFTTSQQSFTDSNQNDSSPSRAPPAYS